MARVTVEDCLKRIPNRFELVLVANHRAKQIIDSNQAKIDMANSKPVTVALREIADALTDKNVLQEPIVSEQSKEEAWAEISGNALSEILLYDNENEQADGLLSTLPSENDMEKDMKFYEDDKMSDLDFRDKEDE